MHQIPSKVLMHFCFMCNAVVILQRNFHHIKTYLLNKKIHQSRRIISALTARFVEKTANATLGHNWFLNIANYLHERKNMNIKIMDSRNKICCPICFLYIYSYFLFLINQYIKPSATRKPPRMQRKMTLSVPSNIGQPAKVRSPYHTVMKIKNTAIKTASKP